MALEGWDVDYDNLGQPGSIAAIGPEWASLAVARRFRQHASLFEDMKTEYLSYAEAVGVLELLKADLSRHRDRATTHSDLRAARCRHRGRQGSVQRRRRARTFEIP